MNAIEGYLWVRFFGGSLSTLLKGFQRSIRGLGLAYGAYISIDSETGLLTFSLERVRS